MKPKLTLLILTLIVSSCSKPKKQTYNKKPVIKAISNQTAYRIGKDWYKGWWNIAPEVAHDTLKVTCYTTKTPFEFKTDSDSIAFELEINSPKDFYIQMDDNTYAHTIVQGTPFTPNKLDFNHSKNTKLEIKYENEESDYLNLLKKKYPLDFLNNKMKDRQVILSVLNWTNSRWKHNGNNSPSKNDAITILNEAEQGKQFPCFAYGIVLRDQLNALGFRARTIYLKTQDAAHRKTSPGHVATEVFLNDLQKWVFVDGQFNVMPTLDGMPLNAVEFQNAISNHYEKFELESLSKEKISKRSYVNFIYDYLYYFDTSLDNRYGKGKRHLVDNKRSVMLVPKGAENLLYINFWNMNIDYCLYTNSLKDFYAIPN